jgi:predicted amidophosphoribosyltransferase
MSLLQDAFDLFLPANCALCQRTPKVICDACLEQFQNRQRELIRGPLHGWALCDLDDSLSVALSAFKESGRFAIADRLIHALLNEASRDWLSDADADLLVAMPSTTKSFAKRGFSPAGIVAKRVAALTGMPVASNSLRFCRATLDQAGLDTVGRAANLAGAMAASRSLANRRVLIIDDIVTTGASVLEAARAIEQVGGRPIGFFAIGETLLRIATPNQK